MDEFSAKRASTIFTSNPPRATAAERWEQRFTPGTWWKTAREQPCLTAPISVRHGRTPHRGLTAQESHTAASRHPPDRRGVGDACIRQRDWLVSGPLRMGPEEPGAAEYTRRPEESRRQPRNQIPGDI